MMERYVTDEQFNDLLMQMGFSDFAIIAGVLEMIARILAGVILIPALGFTGACLASPLAWIFADAFLIPAYFHCKRTLDKGFNVT